MSDVAAAILLDGEILLTRMSYRSACTAKLVGLVWQQWRTWDGKLGKSGRGHFSPDAILY